MQVILENKAMESMAESISYAVATLSQDIEKALRQANAAVRCGDNESATDLNKHIVTMTHHRTNLRALLRAIV